MKHELVRKLWQAKNARKSILVWPTLKCVSDTQGTFLFLIGHTLSIRKVTGPKYTFVAFIDDIIFVSRTFGLKPRSPLKFKLVQFPTGLTMATCKPPFFRKRKSKLS